MPGPADDAEASMGYLPAQDVSERRGYERIFLSPDYQGGSLHPVQVRADVGREEVVGRPPERTRTRSKCISDEHGHHRGRGEDGFFCEGPEMPWNAPSGGHSRRVDQRHAIYYLR